MTDRAPLLSPPDLGLGRLFWAIREAVVVAHVPSGRIVLWNPAAERLFGYSAAEAIGLPLEALVPERLKPRFRAAFARYRETGRGRLLASGRPFEAPAVRKDGAEVTVELTLGPIADAPVGGRFVLACVRDVSDRVARDQAARQSAAIVESSQDAIIGSTPAGVITSWNAGAERLYGYTAAEVVGQSVARLFPPERLGELPGWLGRLGRGERIGPFETQRLRKDGTRLDVSVSLSPVRDAAGQVVGAASITRDITARKRAEAERARLHSALAERESQLEDLVGRLILAQEEERRRVAYNLHDGVAQTVAGAHLHLRAYARRHRTDQPAEREELDRVLELAQRAVREVRTVVGALRPTVLDDLGLEAALRAEVEELKNEGSQVEFDAELGPERLAPAVETALFRVAQEALTSARKHAETRRARVVLRRHGPRVRLEVQDWGRGFDPAAMPAGGGPGERLGLSGMRERVALLGGRCEVKSRPGSGTRVVAEVPLRPSVERADADPARSA